jgi:tRNA(Arg) A34 adenosine deaminase TadA
LTIDRDADSLGDRVAEYVAAHAVSKPRTAQEYFTFLLDHAFRATQEGNYGISAALVVERSGTEIVTVGQNTLISARDPLGHAEINAIRNFERVRSDALSPASDERTRSVLFTTLEPCPMCMVAIVNSGIENVVIALPDEHGGALAPERLSRLPDVWPTLVSQPGRRITFANSSGNDGISPDLRDLLREVLASTTDSATSVIANGVLFTHP